MKKLLFFDLDGTLTDESTGLIPKDTKEAIKKARMNGHLCFLNSGRPNATIEKQFKDMMDGVVLGLGTYIEYDGNILYYSELQQDLCQQIMDLALKCKVECFFEGKDGIVLDENCRIEWFKDLDEKYANQGFNVSYYPKNDIKFEKFCILQDDICNHELFDEFVCQYFRKIDRGNNFYEYEQKGHSKATGIDFLCNYFNTTLENCYAFGDSTNDLPMLEHVTHSVLMGNGPIALRSFVEYVTTNSNENGIGNALKHYGLL